MSCLARPPVFAQSAQSLNEDRVAAIQQRLEGKQQRSAELRQAYLSSIVQRAGNEIRKVEEIAFINSMMDQDRKLMLKQKLEEGESRRQERLSGILQQQAKAQVGG